LATGSLSSSAGKRVHVIHANVAKRFRLPRRNLSQTNQFQDRQKVMINPAGWFPGLKFLKRRKRPRRQEGQHIFDFNFDGHVVAFDFPNPGFQIF
jgi:hypothetical protein